MSWLAYISGSALILLTLTDIYLTVLYIRASTSLVSMHLYHGVWRLFRRIARRAGQSAYPCLVMQRSTFVVLPTFETTTEQIQTWAGSS